MQILSSQSDMYMIKETFQFNVTTSSDTNSVSGIEDQKHFSFNLVAKVRYLDTLGGKITLFPSTCVNCDFGDFLGQIFSNFFEFIV